MRADEHTDLHAQTDTHANTHTHTHTHSETEYNVAIECTVLYACYGFKCDFSTNKPPDDSCCQTECFSPLLQTRWTMPQLNVTSKRNYLLLHLQSNQMFALLNSHQLEKQYYIISLGGCP